LPPCRQRKAGSQEEDLFMRVFSAMMDHESNKFSPIPTTEENFREVDYFSGNQNEPLPDAGDGMILNYGGFVRMIRAAGHEVYAGPAYGAQPSGPLVRADYERMRAHILAHLRKATPVDAVMLYLHGAQLAYGYDDCEGDLLGCIREVVGPEVVISALLDLHGNLTDAMLQHSDILIACKEYPHTDYAMRTADLIRLTAKAVAGEFKPIMKRQYIPMIGTFHTSEEPLRGLVDRVLEMELGEDLSVSFMHGFQWSDTGNVGCNALVVADERATQVSALASEMADAFESAGKAVAAPFWVSIDEAIDAARSVDRGPVIIADIADNAGGGAPGDSTFILQALIERGVENAAFGMIWDPIAVEIATKAGAGAIFPMRIGGKIGKMSGMPIDAEVEVLSVKKCMTGFMTHPDDDCAAVRIGGVDVVLNSVRTQVFAPAPFEALGIDVSSKKIVVVKSSQHFYAAFAPLASRIIYCDSPGSLSSDYSMLPFENLRRPMWPLDVDA
jgi:microcystin degradation protein MlrC